MRTVDLSKYVSAKDQVVSFADFRARTALLILIFHSLYWPLIIIVLFEGDGTFASQEGMSGAVFIASIRNIAILPLVWVLLLVNESYRTVAKSAPPWRIRLSSVLPIPALVTGLFFALVLSEPATALAIVLVPSVSKILVDLGLIAGPVILDFWESEQRSLNIVYALLLGVFGISATIFILRTILTNHRNLRAERNFLSGIFNMSRERRLSVIPPDKRYRRLSGRSVFRWFVLFFAITLICGVVMISGMIGLVWVIDNLPPELVDYSSTDYGDLNGVVPWSVVASATIKSIQFTVPGLSILFAALMVTAVVNRFWPNAVLWAQRGGLRSVEELMSVDQRRPTLYLRSFEKEDSTFSASETTSWRDRLFSFLIRRDVIRLEEEIASAANAIGPLVALDNPRATSLKLGAARRKVDDDHWQAEVLSFMEQAEAVVMIYSNSYGVRWELEQLIDHGYAHKTVVFFPPNEDDYAGEVDNMDLVHALFDTGVQKLSDAENRVAMYLDDSKLVEVITDSKSLAAYRGAMTLARHSLTTK